MSLFDRLRRWTEASDADKGVMDRRAFLKGMAVTSAGLLVPGASVFDLGRSSRGLEDLWSGGTIEIWTSFNRVMNAEEVARIYDTSRGRFASLVAPLTRRLDYASVGRNLFTVEKLPEKLVG